MSVVRYLLVTDDGWYYVDERNLSLDVEKAQEFDFDKAEDLIFSNRQPFDLRMHEVVMN